MSGQRLRWHMRGMNEDMDRTRFDLLTQLYKKNTKAYESVLYSGGDYRLAHAFLYADW